MHLIVPERTDGLKQGCHIQLILSMAKKGGETFEFPASSSYAYGFQ